MGNNLMMTSHHDATLLRHTLKSHHFTHAKTFLYRFRSIHLILLSFRRQVWRVSEDKCGEFQERSPETFRRKMWRVSGDKFLRVSGDMSREFQETCLESFRRQLWRVLWDKCEEFQETSAERSRREVQRVSGDKCRVFQETFEKKRPRMFYSR